MTGQRVLCPTSATWHGRHMATDRRWTITTPEGAEAVLCSAACALSWLIYALPADLGAAGANTVENTDPGYPMQAGIPHASTPANSVGTASGSGTGDTPTRGREVAA